MNGFTSRCLRNRQRAKDTLWLAGNPKSLSVCREFNLQCLCCPDHTSGMVLTALTKSCRKQRNFGDEFMLIVTSLAKRVSRRNPTTRHGIDVYIVAQCIVIQLAINY